MNNKKKVKSKSKSKKESVDPTKDFPDPVPEIGTVEKVESPGGPGPVKGGSYTEIGKGGSRLAGAAVLLKVRFMFHRSSLFCNTHQFMGTLSASLLSVYQYSLF